MSDIILDEEDIRNLPHKERLEKCRDVLKNENDESKRWDAVWLAGELAESVGANTEIFEKVADLMVWVLKNDDNGVVKHEACFQIAARNMRNKISDLINSSLNDKSGLVKHEALEALGLMRAHERIEAIEKGLKDSNQDVRETAMFVIKRLNRLKDSKKEYVPSEII